MNTSILLKKILSALKEMGKLINAGHFEEASVIGNMYFSQFKDVVPSHFRFMLHSAFITSSKFVLEDQIYYTAGKKKALKDLVEAKSFFVNNLSGSALREEEDTVNQYIQEKILRVARKRRY